LTITPAEETTVKTITLAIDRRTIKVPPGSTVLQAARAAGIYIPTLCDDPHLKPFGATHQTGWLGVYQQTILNAFRETNDALTGSQKKIRESAMQVERVVALREFARLSRLRFDKGVTGYLDVLIAENELFAAELASARILADRYTQQVSVYQAMGGGWVEIAASMAPQPQGMAAGSLQ